MTRTIVGCTVLAAILAIAGGAAGATQARHTPPHHSPSPGLGATLAAWKSAYHEDSRGCDDNSCFGPAWHHADAGLRFEYGEVSYSKGRVGSYSEAFLPNTPVTVAEREILATLPGAHGGPVVVVKGSSDSDGCGQLNVTSAGVGKELGAYDPTGEVGIEFETLPASGNAVYSATNVQSAMVLAASATPGSC